MIRGIIASGWQQIKEILAKTSAIIIIAEVLWGTDIAWPWLTKICWGADAGAFGTPCRSPPSPCHQGSSESSVIQVCSKD
ncbi:MAG: hypothetical protein CMA06_05375 [Euryarchaeota archaeon]|nr:hypothetical protein [Euryarchaeota archaeon]RCH71733.1 MAG: hypothetical protein DBX06_04250 [Candidatus Poseidoniales archaeon]RCH72480.1 MAG: hypothetical protein DBX06_00970 [Candidatus Poseidoniales archaeon]